MKDLKINVEEHVFDDKLLDVIESQFKASHDTGLAEWLKNSVDAYNREIGKTGKAIYADQDQFIFIRVTPKTAEMPICFECIDFVGMREEDIEKALKRWGDTKAASRGIKKNFLGGHGNGGKLYMRAMFETAQFITYRDGKLTIFGFNKQGKYGYADGFREVEANLMELVREYDLKPLIAELPGKFQTKLKKKKLGFTIVRGVKPKNHNRGRNTPAKIIENLRTHSQAKRIILRKPVYCVMGIRDPFRLIGDRLHPKEGFDEDFVFEIPKTLPLGSDIIAMANKDYENGYLVLKTSDKPLGGGRINSGRANLNCIEHISGIGVIGIDKINELPGIENRSESEFIYGECSCPILESPDSKSVNNDRVHLVKTAEVLALRDFIADKINELTGKIAEQNKIEQSTKNLSDSSKINEYLNGWIRQNKLIDEIKSTIFGGNPPAAVHSLNEFEKKEGEEKQKKKPEEDSKEKKPKSPQKPSMSEVIILLSNHDPDPLSSNLDETVQCSPRHPVVYQRDTDIHQGIFWINTQNPLARLIRESKNDGTVSIQWKNYMFQRYIDIMFKQSLYVLEQANIEINAVKVDELMDKLVIKINSLAAEDKNIQKFLFN
ncbi:ATP-binding protein [Verrucomicrobia bacterium]|nr:ATP-binding protein [Verrucomicrobiota bacterium]